MNKSLVTGLAAGAVVAVGASAFAGLKMMHSSPQYAQVLKVTPLTRTVRTPRQECHDEAVTQKAPVKDEHQVIGTVAGAVIGGVIGHQIGGGTGRDIATVAGAAGGGYAGNRIQKNLQDRDTTTTTEQKCATVYDSSTRHMGYEVRYRLNGQEATVKMDHDPGERIPVRDGKLVIDRSAGTAATSG
ncbi:MAG TPA: glycine zipper 2TM domain-containing protein [Steroidobacteraceae bacterium]|nr:glycine zipper 2TM domain-containing protein [Steroidobacteraceae bacterium]